MSTQVPVLSGSIQETVRHTADFKPSLWGNQFLTFTSDFKTIDVTTQEEYEALKQEVRRKIAATEDKPAQKLRFIDAVQRLGVAYHFEEEIKDALEQIYHDFDSYNNDLYTVSLRFRLLRQKGNRISCDLFEKFKDNEGKFKGSLMEDVQGMLSLYEAAHLAIHGEGILDEALAFSTTHLKTMIARVSPNLVEQINHALYRPLRRTLPRLQAKFFFNIYPSEDFHNKTLLKFAKLDFNMLQAAHQEELRIISQWWKELDFTTKLPYARDRLVELYFWVVGVYFEPKFALARRILTKVIYMTSILDDTFDAYGTLEELKLFTEVVKRWNRGCTDILPEYMKIIYKTLLDIYDEIEEVLAKEGRLYGIRYAKEKMQQLVEMYFMEAKWFFEGHVPTMDEYFPVASKTGGNLMLGTVSFLGMGDIATQEAFDWLSNIPKILRASLLICRLLDDTASHRKRGHVASAVECYMKQHGVTEEEAVKVFRQEIEDAWKDINEEFLEPTAVPSPLLERIFNLTRMIELSYRKGDAYTHAHLMKDQVASILKDPVML